MLIGPALQNSQGSGVALPTGVNFFTSGSQPPLSQVYSGVKFSSDGNVYKLQANGGWSQVDSWLKYGSASTYYIARTVTSGTLDSDAGTDLQLNADRIYYIADTDTGVGFEAASVRFSITNSGGGVVYDGPVIYSFNASLTAAGVEEP